MSSVSESSARLFWLIILSAIFPPLAVAIEFGMCWDLLWNILLTLLIPFGGFIHSVYILCCKRYTSPLRNMYEQINDNDTEAEADRHESRGYTHSEDVSYTDTPIPTSSDTVVNETEENSTVPPPPYASPGANITYDNKVQYNR